MMLLQNIFSLVLNIGFSIALNIEFIARINTISGNVSTKFENLSAIGCCTQCGLDESCLATNYNLKTAECGILTQHPDVNLRHVVPRQDWTLYTTADGCGGNWVPFNQSCYLLVKTKRIWGDADDHCRAHNAELVDIHSPEENAFVFNYSNDNGARRVWIGLNDAVVENQFRWSSGKPLTFTAFTPGQPDNKGGGDCVSNLIVYNEWDDINCERYRLASVCEKTTY